MTQINVGIDKDEHPSQNNDLFQTNNALEGFGKLSRKSRRIQIVWFCLFLMTIGGCIFHAYEIVSQYLTYPKVSNIQYNAVPFVFPDVTLCHPFLFKTVKEKLTVPNTNKQYGKQIFDRNIRSFWSLFLTGNEVSEINRTWDSEEITSASVKSFMYYISNTSSVLGPEDTMLACYYRGKKCDIRNFTVILHGTHGFCFQFQPMAREVFDTGPEAGFFLLHNSWDYVNTIHPKIPAKHIPGLKVFINEAFSWPDSIEPVTLAQRTQIVEAGIRRYKYNKLNTPSDPCRAEQKVERCFLTRGRELKCRYFTNSDIICRHDYFQDRLYKKCGCIVFEWLLKPIYKNSMFCLHVPDNVYENYENVLFLNDSATLRKPANNITSSTIVFNTFQLKTRYDCYQKIIEEAENMTFKPCTPSCTRVDQLIILDRYPKNNPGPSSVATVTAIVEENLDFLNEAGYNNESLKGLLSMPNQIVNQLSGNAGTLEVYAIEKEGPQTTEDFRYYKSSLFSDLGGSLGLWIGCSALSILEMSEMLFILCERFRQTRKSVDNL